MPDERVDEDVAVVRAGIWASPFTNAETRKEAHDRADAALDRLQARLEAAEAEASKVGDIVARLLMLEAERNEARADAENLRRLIRENNEKHHNPISHDLRDAIEPHLTGPKRPPTGTSYVTDEPDFEILQEPAPEKTLDRLRKRVESGDWESDDVGPPAPGEGEPEDGYPNPELEVEC